MKLEKNKLIFASVILTILLLIGGYGVYIMDDKESPVLKSNQIPVPELEGNQKEYRSKLDAINDLKEVRETNAPSIYDERLLDSTGVYDPDLLDKEKMHMVDSIYNSGRINYADNHYRKERKKTPIDDIETPTDSITQTIKESSSSKELALEHQLFFASNPKETHIDTLQDTDAFISVMVDGTQTVKTNYRLRMRLLKDVVIQGVKMPRNTAIYGFVSFQPNRTIIDIKNINHYPVKFKAYDLEDGSEGIYTENSFRADATREVVGDVVQDINIAGLPQVGGVKKIFQRDNRTIKVTVLDNYQLILKAY